MKNKHSIKFISFSWKRFLCALILTSIGILNLIAFSPLSGRHVPTGSIMTFEGPSYFLSSGLIPFITGIGLLLYSLLSYFKGEILSLDNDIVVREKRFIKVIETKLDFNGIFCINLKNNEIGIKYLWLFLFVPYIIVNYYYMVLNFNQPFIIGFANITAIIILISIIFSVFSMIILFVFPQWLLEFYTKEGRFELWFEPFKDRRETINQIAFALRIVEGKENENIYINPFKNLSLRNIFTAFFFLIYGLFNILSNTTTLAIYQTIISHILLIMSIYMISSELRKIPISETIDKNSNLKYKIQSKYYQEFIYCKSGIKIEERYLHNDFEVFWVICTGIIFIIVPLRIIQSWMVLNLVNFTVILDNSILLTIFGAIIMILVAIYLFMPMKILQLSGDDLKLKSLILNTEKTDGLNLIQLLQSFGNCFKLNFKDQILKKQFLKRLLFISICIIIGIMFLMWQYFFYFNLFNIFNF